ncbi:MAG TPA: hypothetical protein DER40_13315 [Geobacter sp.]|nr:hypothetical protein [Geobacter sp.]
MASAPTSSCWWISNSRLKSPWETSSAILTIWRNGRVATPIRKKAARQLAAAKASDSATPRATMRRSLSRSVALEKLILIQPMVSLTFCPLSTPLMISKSSCSFSVNTGA